MTSLLLALVVATGSGTLTCHAWVTSRGPGAYDRWVRQEVACVAVNDPAVFKVPTWLLPDPQPGQVLSFCVDATVSGQTSACAGPDAGITQGPMPPRPPFQQVPQ
jgi:hypothetical protein